MSREDRANTPRMLTIEQVREVLNSGALVCDAEVVAAALGVTTWTLYDAVKRGDAPIMPIMVGRRQRYRVSDLRKLLGIDEDGCNG